MIPLTTLYNDYIYQPKLNEQKNQFAYIVPPPAKVGRNKNCRILLSAYRARNITRLALFDELEDATSSSD